MSIPAPRVDWFFGRGLSIGCGLSWSVPDDWRDLHRNEQIPRIKYALRDEMNKPSIDCSDIRDLLSMLSTNTVTPWRHQFITTNWDYLLQREVDALGLTEQPDWAAETHVFHLNGTVEQLLNNDYRSPFLLESDPQEQRTATLEAEKVFACIVENKHFVIVGMSFECDTDKFLLDSLSHIERDWPIGKSKWILINPNATDLEKTRGLIQDALPSSTIVTVNKSFREWLSAQAPELKNWGAIRS